MNHWAYRPGEVLVYAPRDKDVEFKGALCIVLDQYSVIEYDDTQEQFETGGGVYSVYVPSGEAAICALEYELHPHGEQAWVH